MSGIRWSANQRDRARKAAAAGVSKGAAALQTALKETLSKPGTGRHHPGLRYRSSAPGEPPTVQTGNLRRSVAIGAASVSSIGPTHSVRIGAGYGAMLEKRTRNARPFVRPTLADPKARDAVIRATISGFKKSWGRA